MFSEMARRASRLVPSALDIDFLAQQAQRSSSPESAFLIGLSVSQGAPCGIAILERFKPPPPPGRRSSATYVCRYLRRWLPPDTAYPVLVSELAVILSGPLVSSELIVEAGPSIRPVVSMLRKHRLPARIRPVEVKVSAEDTFVGNAWRVGKGSLIETTRLLLQEERMSFDEHMPAEVMATTPSVRTVYQALLTYPFDQAPAANEAFAAREGEYDDLVLAVALACWSLNKRRFRVREASITWLTTTYLLCPAPGRAVDVAPVLPWSWLTLLPAQRRWTPTRIGASTLRLQERSLQQRNTSNRRKKID